MHKLFLLILLITITIGVITYFPKKNMTSSPITTQTYEKKQLANPASINCTEKGGTSIIQTNPSGGEYGLCQFQDDMACEEWALFRGDCPVGGVKTTGFDTMAQKYCAWVGGKTLAVEHATCTLPSGKICDDEALYAGSCE